MPNMITVVGIDPSLTNTGLARAEVDLSSLRWRVEALQLVSTEMDKRALKVVRKSSDDLRRGKVLIKGVREFCNGASFVIAEVPTGTQSARGSFSNGVCCGLLAGIALERPLIEVSPTEVKMAAVGHKHAGKEEMIEWAVKRFPDAAWLRRRVKGEMRLMNDNEHLADAVAAIAAGLLTPLFEQTRSIWMSKTA